MNVLEVNFEKKNSELFPLHIQFQAEGRMYRDSGSFRLRKKKNMTFKAIAGIVTPDSENCLGGKTGIGFTEVM